MGQALRGLKNGVCGWLEGRGDGLIVQVACLISLLAFLAPPAQAADGLVKDSASGCAVFKPNLKPGDAVSWQGACSSGQATGPGVARWTASDNSSLTFEGTFTQGRMQGAGKMTASGGDQYVGSYKDGKRDGQGVYVAANKEQYEGGYKENQRHGHGVVTLASGAKVEGDWVNGVHTAKTPTPDVAPANAATTTPANVPAAQLPSTAPPVAAAPDLSGKQAAFPVLPPRALPSQQDSRQDPQNAPPSQAQLREQQREQENERKQQQQAERRQAQESRVAQQTALQQQQRERQLEQEALSQRAQEEKAAEQLRLRREQEAERLRLFEERQTANRIAGALLLSFPLLLGGAVGGFKSQKGVSASNGLGRWVSRRLDRSREKRGYFSRLVERPTMWSAQQLFAVTGSIANQFIQAGVRLALFTFLIMVVAFILLFLAMGVFYIFMIVVGLMFSIWLVNAVMNPGQGPSFKPSRLFTFAGGQSRNHKGLLDSYTRTETPDGVYKTKTVEGMFDTHEETRDSSGQIVAKARVKEGLFGDKYTEITNAEGEIVGRSHEVDGFFDPKTVTTDPSGKVIGESRKREGLFGGSYTEHTPKGG